MGCTIVCALKNAMSLVASSVDSIIDHLNSHVVGSNPVHTILLHEFISITCSKKVPAHCPCSAYLSELQGVKTPLGYIRRSTDPSYTYIQKG
jgi:hypothetical protein